jgi:hypothetical protein
MGIRDEIFPYSRREDYVQTEWAKGWAYAAIGYREAARFLTKHRRDFRASIDQVGLVIFFIQRHCVELALKELLVSEGVDLKEIKSQHSLVALWYACREVVGSETDGWVFLEKEGGNLVELLDDADPGSYGFRYPVDRDDVEYERPACIDLDALATHVSRLTTAVDGYLDHRSEDEQAKREYEDELRYQADY